MMKINNFYYTFSAGDVHFIHKLEQIHNSFFLLTIHVFVPYITSTTKVTGEGSGYWNTTPTLYHCNPMVTLLFLRCRGERQEKPLDF